MVEHGPRAPVAIRCIQRPLYRPLIASELPLEPSRMNDRPSHPLLDRLEAKHSPPSLKETSLVMLRLHWSGQSQQPSGLLPVHPNARRVNTLLTRGVETAVRDVGDAPFSLLKSLLPHSAADQLAEIEDNSPHIAPHTNGAERCADTGDPTVRESYELTFSAPRRPTGIWRELCVHEFIEVRKAVEDGRIPKKEEPKSWREQYSLEEVKREVRSLSPFRRLTLICEADRVRTAGEDAGYSQQAQGQERRVQVRSRDYKGGRLARRKEAQVECSLLYRYGSFLELLVPSTHATTSGKTRVPTTPPLLVQPDRRP